MFGVVGETHGHDYFKVISFYNGSFQKRSTPPPQRKWKMTPHPFGHPWTAKPKIIPRLGHRLF